MKVLNTFSELIAALEVAVKKEKKEEYKEYIKRILENVKLWKAKYDSFITAAGQKKEDDR